MHAGGVFPLIIAASVGIAVSVAPTTVTGWSSAPVSVAPGRSVVDNVRVHGAGRHRVLLQVSGTGAPRWQRVWQRTTDKRGRLTVRFPVLTEGARDFRLKVPATRKSARTVTVARRITVRAPDPSSSPAPQSATVFVAGDIGMCPPAGTPDRTAALIDTATAVVVVPGDLAYPAGTATDFATCYDPYYGAFRDVTLPVPGNHEYASGATAYFAYFGDRVGTQAAPWYAVTVGPWRFYMLNSNCGSVGGCGVDSPQYRWLAAQLASNPPQCTAAVWHHPRWSSGQHGPYAGTSDLYELLAAHGTDLLLTGHEHNYERFAPMAASGAADRAGIRQFVVGTGGQTMRSFASTAAGSEVRLNRSSGVLRMRLAAGDYTWEFLPTTPGSDTDYGTDTCH